MQCRRCLPLTITGTRAAMKQLMKQSGSADTRNVSHLPAGIRQGLPLIPLVITKQMPTAFTDVEQLCSLYHKNTDNEK